MADPAGPALTLRFVAGPDVDALDVGRAEILAAVEGAVRAQGEGEVVLEPRVHLTPPNGGAGHFNVLRGHLGPEHVSGVKVVGDFVGNWRRGLPSELALVLLLDPDTGMPLGIVDGTLLTAARTGALTALGARHLARPDSRVLGHLGARGSAWWNVAMLDDLFDFDEIRVTSRRASSREAFAARLSEDLGKPVRAAVSHVPSTTPSGMPVSGSSSSTRASSLGSPRRQLPTKSPTTLTPLTCAGPRWPRRTLKCLAPPLGGARWTRGSSTTLPSPWARTAPSTAARISARPTSRASTSGPATNRKLRAGPAGSASRWPPSPGPPCRCRPAC